MGLFGLHPTAFISPEQILHDLSIRPVDDNIIFAFPEKKSGVKLVIFDRPKTPFGIQFGVFLACGPKAAIWCADADMKAAKTGMLVKVGHYTHLQTMHCWKICATTPEWIGGVIPENDYAIHRKKG